MAEDNRRKKSLIFLAAGLIVVVVIAIFALDRHAPMEPVVTVARGNLSETITSNGKVEPISPDIARAEFPTFVEKVMATEGQAVHRGQVILKLDDSAVRAQLAQAQAQALATQMALANARQGGPPDQVAQLRGNIQQERLEEVNLQRTEKALEQLVAKQAATQDELAQNQAALEKAQAQLKELEQRKKDLAEQSTVDAQSATLRLSEANGEVRSLEEQVRSATVVASTDGTLYSLPVQMGDYVKVGDVLAEMTNLMHVRVRAFVDEPDLGWLEPGEEVQVMWDAKPGRVWTGQTEQIPKQVVPHGTRSVGEVLCSVDNAQLELLPNINVEVRILVRRRAGVVIVPRAAVREDNGRHYVFVLSDDRLHRQEITVGVASASQYEVVAGLQVNDRVALPGDQDLRDGMEIQPTEAQ